MSSYRLGTILVLLALSFGTAWAQYEETTWFGPDYNAEVFQYAYYLKHRSYPNEAAAANARAVIRAIFNKVIEEHAGTGLEAAARLNLAQMAQEEAEMREQLDLIKERFAGTCYWFVARAMEARILSPDGQENAEQDELFRQIGARPWSEVIDDIPDPPFSEDSIPEAYRQYVHQRYILRQAEAQVLEVRFRGALFLRNTFKNDNYGFYDLKTYLKASAGVTDQPRDTTPPLLLAQSPADGARLPGVAELFFRASAGNYQQSQIDKTKTRLVLDGEDVSPELSFHSELSADPNSPYFETMEIRFTPTTPLAAGPHTAALTLADGLNEATTSFTFHVDTPPQVNFVDPKVKLRSPKSNDNTGPRPRIRFEASVDFGQARIDQDKIQILLDGQPLTTDRRLRHRLKKNPRPGKWLERIRVEARPAQRLTPGNHRLELVVPTIGYSGTGPGITRITSSFRVGRDKDREDDECPDWPDDRDWERDSADQGPGSFWEGPWRSGMELAVFSWLGDVWEMALPRLSRT